MKCMHRMCARAVSLTICLTLATAAATAQTCTPPPELRSTLRDQPGAPVYNDLGVWFADHQQYDCAATAFGSSLQADPQQRDLPHVVFMFGSALYLSGDIKEAIPSLREAERLGYRDEKIHAILASALDAKPSRPEAEAEWRQALEFDPDSTSALDALSADLLADGDYKGVIETLDQPRLAGQRSAQQTLNLATTYLKTGKLDRAAVILQDGLNTHPDSVEIAQQLAAVLTQLGREEEAAAVLQLAQARQRDLQEDPAE